MFHIKMDKCLFDAKSILDSLGIPFYLCTGTALGFRREGGFIAHDYDIDLGVDEEHASAPEIVRAFLESGKFHAHFLPVINGQHVELSFVHHNTNSRIDIFLTFSDEQGENLAVYNVLWDFKPTSPGQDHTGNPILMYYKQPYSLTTVEFKGVEFACPDESYLAQTYGENWRIPVDFKKLGGDPYLSSLTTKHRPNLLTATESAAILTHKFGSPLVLGRK